MTVAFVVAYVLTSFVAVAWFVRTQLDGLMRVVGWLLWLASPVVFPVLVFNAIRARLAH